MILEAHDLVKTYSRQGKTFEAVSHVSISAGKGDVLVLTGPSGCGKSTLFHMLSGIITPDVGSITVNGREITSLPKKGRTALRLKEISYVLQGDSLLYNFTVLENVCLPSLLEGGMGKNEIRAKAMELLKQFGMEPLAQSYPSELSGGERRRAAIARALIPSPSVIIADEPTADLDEENTAIILDCFLNQKDKAVLISTHDLSCLRKGVRHYTMRKGVMEYAGIV